MRHALGGIGVGTGTGAAVGSGFRAALATVAIAPTAAPAAFARFATFAAGGVRCGFAITNPIGGFGGFSRVGVAAVGKFARRRDGRAAVRAGCGFIAVATTATTAAVAASAALAFALCVAGLGRMGSGQGVDERLRCRAFGGDALGIAFGHGLGAARLTFRARATAAFTT